jgi:DNA invertase Pin-like site-specific DNA recombinase
VAVADTPLLQERSERARRARLAGGGRKPVVDRETVIALRKAGKTLKETAEGARCSVHTVVRIMAEAQGGETN